LNRFASDVHRNAFIKEDRWLAVTAVTWALDGVLPANR